MTLQTPLDPGSAEEPPFEGLRVIDASQGVAGPHCGMLLALNGADVVKVEPPGGDWGRAIGRQYDDFSAYNLAFNRGKRSIALDLKSDAGASICRRLMCAADVVIENYRPGVLARFGLDYATVKATNADVVYTSITGFGQEGPRSSLPATDSILQAFSGLMSVNLDAQGTPQRIGVLVIDVVTGLYAFQAIATALYRRATRGGGKHIETSLMEAIGAVQAGKMVEYHLEGPEGQKPGVPVATYRAADGYLTINARRDRHFVALTELLGVPGLGQDPRYRTPQLRAQHEQTLMPILRERVAQRSRAELCRELESRDILHAPVNDYADYLADPHVQESGAIQWVEHPGVGRIPLHRIPGLPSVSSADPGARSPALGEDTRAVLAELGYDRGQIAELTRAGAVVDGHGTEAAD